MTCLSDEQNDDANTWSQLLYERNISKQNLMHINYRERIAENTEQQWKRVKFITDHFNNRFYEEYILALRERHKYDFLVKLKFNNERNFRNSHPEVFLRKGFLKICSKEHPCRSDISIKLHNRPSAWVFSSKFAAYFLDTFSQKHLCGCFCNFYVNDVVLNH